MSIEAALFVLLVLLLVVPDLIEILNEPFVSRLTPEQERMLEDPEDGTLS